MVADLGLYVLLLVLNVLTLGMLALAMDDRGDLAHRAIWWCWITATMALNFAGVCWAAWRIIEILRGW